MRAISYHGFGGAFAVAARNVGLELDAVVEPGGFGAEIVERNREALRFNGPILTAAEPDPWDGPVDLVFGNPPCSGFSGLNMHPNGENFRGVASPLNQYMFNLIDYAARLNHGAGPTTVVFESVPAAGRVGRGLMQELHGRLEEATGKEYYLSLVFMSGASVGAAQLRKRFFFVATRHPFGIDPPEIRRVATYEDAIGDLVGVPLGRGPEPYPSPEGTWWSEGLRRPVGVTDHVVLAQPAVLRYNVLGPYWRSGENHRVALARYLDEHDGASPPGWENVDPKRVLFGPKLVPSVRVRPDEMGRVVTSAGGAGFFHYAEDRYLTVRECARLMGFPDDVSFDNLSPGKAFSFLGKQVPVQSWEWILRQVMMSATGVVGAWAGDYEANALGRYRVFDVTQDYKTVYDDRRRIHGVDARSTALTRTMDRRYASDEIEDLPSSRDETPSPARPPRPKKSRATRRQRPPARAVRRYPSLVLEGEKLERVVRALECDEDFLVGALDAWTDKNDLVVLYHGNEHGPTTDLADGVDGPPTVTPAWWGCDRWLVRYRGAMTEPMVRGLVEIEARGIPFLVHPESTDEKAVDEVVSDDAYLRRVPGRVSPGETWLDLGANIGAFSLLALSEGAARVVAYEPHPENAALLRRNGDYAVYAGTLEVVEAAVVADEASATMDLYVLKDDASRYRHHLWPVRGRGKIPVRVESLIEVLGSLRPDGVKMDIEGAELAILDEKIDWRAYGVKKLVLEYHFATDDRPEAYERRVAALRDVFDEVWIRPYELPLKDGRVNMFPDGRPVAAWVREDRILPDENVVS